MKIIQFSYLVIAEFLFFSYYIGKPSKSLFKNTIYI